MKRVFSLILCLSMVLCVCGCGNADTESEIIEVEHEQVYVDADGNPVSGGQQITESGNDSDVQTPSNNNDSSDTTPNTPTQTETVIDYNTTVEVDICDDVIRGYLTSTTPEQQYFWLSEYGASNYDYQTIEFDWTYDGSSEVTITLSENADFSNPTVLVTRTSTVTTTALVPGKTYYWKAVGNVTDNIIGGGKIKVKDTPVRWIKIDGTGNVRDMGGWKTESGKTVKYEMLYRGQALDNVSSTGISTIKQLGFKTEIDIRSSKNDRNPPSVSGMKYVFLSTTAQYDNIFSSNATYKEEVISNYKKIFELLSNESNYPIYTHCSAGADRTGTYAFILNGLLGVSYEDLTRDFELTSFSSSGKRWRGNGDGGTFAANDLEMKVDGNYVAWGVLYKEMMETYGTGDGKLSSAIERFLITYVGVPKTQIDSFKSIMLE